MLNKKGINFGLWLLIITLVLFGLIVGLFFFSNKNLNTSFETEKINQINNEADKLGFYFSDSMQVGFDKTMNELANNSFITDPSTCSFYDDKIILEDTCLPDKTAILTKLKEGVLDYLKSSAQSYYHSTELDSSAFSCDLLGDILDCKSGPIMLNETKKSSFFNYTIYYNFSLEKQLNISEKIDFDEIVNMPNIDFSRANVVFNDWEVISADESDDHVHEIVSLNSKSDFFNFNEEKILPLAWSFAVLK
jgi:hypothetical protein